MRILTIHSDYLNVEPQAKALKTDYDKESQPLNANNVLVVFTAVENDDQKNKTEVIRKATKEIINIYNQVKASEIVIYPYAHLSSNLAPSSFSNQLLNDLVKKIKEFAPVKKAPFGYYKKFEIKCKGHPLSELSREITVEEEENLALKEEKKLKSYWYILDVDGKLTPVEEFDFTGHDTLKKFADYEIKKNREYAQPPAHVKYMRAQELVGYEPGSDAGNLRWYPKGELIKTLLEEKINNITAKIGGMQVETPIMYDINHPNLNRYLNRFPNRHYLVRSGEKEYFLRFAACFGQYLIMKDMTISYKQLPVKLYELTHYSFRREQKGELAGLKRLRAFTMPDMHTLVADMDAAKKEFLNQYKESIKWMEDLGVNNYEAGIRFVKDFYEENKEFAASLAKEIGRPVLIEMWDKRPFYFVMKFEFNFVDASDKATALSTVQIDVENTERFDINYIDSEGKKKYPILLHASLSGAIERNIYALLEKAYLEQKKGNTPMLPLWLSPTQVRIIPVNQNHLKFAEELADTLEKQNIRVDIDDNDSSIGKKIMNAEQEWVPYQIVVGDKEVNGGDLQVRVRANKGEILTTNISGLVDLIKKETKGQPYKPLPLPRLLSKRPKFV